MGRSGNPAKAAQQQAMKDEIKATVQEYTVTDVEELLSQVALFLQFAGMKQEFNESIGRFVERLQKNYEFNVQHPEET